MAKKQLGQVDADLLARVDVARGDVPRVRWVERVLEAALGNRGGPPSAVGGDEAVISGGRAPASPPVSVGLHATQAGASVGLSKRCPNGCVSGVTSPAVVKCRLCQAKLVPEP